MRRSARPSGAECRHVPVRLIATTGSVPKMDWRLIHAVLVLSGIKHKQHPGLTIILGPGHR